MREVGDRLAVIEGVDITRVGIDSVTVVPDTLPDELVAEFDADFAMH